MQSLIGTEIIIRKEDGARRVNIVQNNTVLN